MLAIALVADIVLCAVFALTVRVGRPPDAEVARRQATIVREQAAVRAHAYDLGQDVQVRTDRTP